MPFKTFAVLLAGVVLAAGLTVFAVTSLAPNIGLGVVITLTMVVVVIMRRLNG